jgi:hypothetical protein
MTYYSSLTEQEVKSRFDDIKVIHTLADGHTADLKFLKDRLNWLYDSGKKSAQFTEAQKRKFENKHPDLMDYLKKRGIFVKNAEFAKFFVYKDDSGNVKYKREESEIDGFKLTDEVKYYIKVERYFKNKKGESAINALSALELQEDERGRGYTKQFGLDNESFNDILKVTDIGDAIQVYFPSKDNPDKNEYRTGIVTKKTNSMMSVAYIVKSNDDTFYPCSINLYGNKYDDGSLRVKELYTMYRKEKQEAFSNMKRNIKQSKETEIIKKSHDSKEAVSLITRNLKNIYNANVEVMSNEQMVEMGSDRGLNLEGTRACVIDGKIYINIDRASTADVLHEFTHILLPGLKARNPEAYKAILAKVQEHPAFEQVKAEYKNLNDADLAEETFCTIFGEYFRKQLMSKDEQAWFDGNFMDIASSVADVVKDVAQVDFDFISSYDLMNMSLDEIMDQFGSDLITGKFDRVYEIGYQIESNNNDVSRVYQSLIDSGDLLIIC